jgi:ketosteroid isomerase-like protein
MTTRASASGTPVERMYFAWNDALSRNDAPALLALYADASSGTIRATPARASR